MTILDFYQQKRIPKNLQRHMFRVAAVGEYIAQHWKGEIDQESIVQTLLLHDLGNLLKFDLHKTIEFFDEDERDQTYWLKIQAEMRSQYGESEYDATYAMAQEYGANERVLQLIKDMSFGKMTRILESNDMELKVVSYSDLRVGPFGFLTIEERFEDFFQRYKGSSKLKTEKDITELFEDRDITLEVEKQIQAKVDIDLQNLPEKKLERFSL